MTKEVLRIPVIRATVLGVEVVRGYARLCDLSEVSQADVYDAKTNPTGTQRDLSPKHARDAYDYIRSEDIAFWPEIFLALRNRKVFEFTSQDGNTGYGFATLDLEKISRSKGIAISRVDGNHRLHFANGKTEGYPPIEKEVSFCLAVNITLDEEIKLFRDINNNQRRMNTSHLDNIKVRLQGSREVARRDPMLYIATRLKSDNDSPLKGLVYDGGKSDITKFIPLRTLKTGLEYMFSRPTALTAVDDIEIQVHVIKNYFSALRAWEPEAWKRPKEYLLLRGAGLWGACFLGAEIIDRALSKGRYKSSDMLDILKSGRDWDWGREGDFKGLSGRSGSLKIRDAIVSELQDESGVSLKSLMRKISDEI